MERFILVKFNFKAKSIEFSTIVWYILKYLKIELLCVNDKGGNILKKSIKTLAVWLIIGIILVVSISAIYDNMNTKLAYSELISKIEAGEVEEIELSADGPLREPYAAYFQGGLTWYHAKLGIIMSMQKMYEEGLITVE